MIRNILGKIAVIICIIKIQLFNCLEVIKEIDEHIKYYESSEAKEKLLELFKYNCTQSNLGELINQYANLIYYGQNDDNNSLKLSYYFYKLAAYYGQQDALFMTSLFSNFRLDGSYNILQNLDRLLEKAKNTISDINNQTSSYSLDNLSQLELLSIYQYVSEKRNSSSVLDLYLSSQQQNFFSKLALAHKYMHGRGVNIDCRTASLYFKDLGKDQYLDSDQVPNLSKIIRLDLQIYSMTSNLFSFNLNSDKIKILETFKHISLNYQSSNLGELLNLAESYFYGINGVRRDFNKSFEIYQSIYSKKNISQNINTFKAGAMLGYHYMRGYGVKKDYQMSFSIFQSLSDQGDTISLNGLGYLYYNGYGVKKDQRKAISLFKKSASLKDVNGMYNYGVIHMLPSTDIHLRDKQIAHQYLNLASEKGHALAQYALGLLYLDGVDFYQSCELSTLLMSRSMSRSASSHFQNSANYLYSLNNYRQSHLNYLISGYLGDDVSLQNAAILADKYSGIYTYNDINFYDLENELKQDPIYNLLVEKKFIEIDFHELLFEDILQMVKNKTTLNNLLKIEKNSSKNSISGYVSYQLLKTSISQSGYSNLRLGDYFYYGINVKQSYSKAYQYYKLAAEKKDSNIIDQVSYIQAQGYFNLAYMEQLGQGVPQNYQLAYMHLNQSLSLTNDNFLANVLLRINFLEDILKIHDPDTQKKIINQLSVFFKQLFNDYKSLFKVLSCIPFILMIIYLYGKRLRIKHEHNV
ncbi:Sel1 domain protein (macronuclear) [Tetrahymena thermophila SB210]|uniref:Sel1 domain protein n=1 Tax=Tetrahymena thermophila (strain SB210) TaxID=312017 RepID=I7LWP2_TETTS|nr:Sel1 domain protein [Tetrahymena thermophila SB210]EAS02454.2 Sel1 domain protein [Tetrahymena thermophila SB210]|eukprot:XP_001022699.2 Sel1 domain protein [Tetrahymena thermophila SB210]